MPIVPIMIPAENAIHEKFQGDEEITKKMNNVAMGPTTPERPITGTSVRISVPLDTAAIKPARSTATVYTERKLMRRDSLDRREAFLKGKEGSRQRRRWENGMSHHTKTRHEPP
jgi:hypothetical protein